MPSPLLHNCHGARPSEIFEDFFPDGIADLSFSNEGRVLAVGTQNGHVSLLSASGHRIVEDRGFAGLSRIRICASGSIGAAVVGDRSVVLFNSRLKPLWDAEMTGRIVSLAISPFGSHVAFSTDSCRLHVVSADRREVFRVDTRRPVEHLEFLTEEPHLIAAAEFGEIARYDLKGRQIWSEQLPNNAGDMAVSEGPKRLFLAAYNHGVQVFDFDGQQLGSFAVDGIPAKVSASVTRTRVAVMTLENRIYWLNFDGAVQWAVDISHDPPQFIVTGPLGDRLFIATHSGCLLQVGWP